MHVAFVRNCNQGQRGHPSTADLVAAFAEAGAVAVSTFRSNGTIVFDTPGSEDAGEESANATVLSATRLLAAASGSHREIFHLPLDVIGEIADAYGIADDVHRQELTLHDGTLGAFSVPGASAIAAHRRVRVLACGAGWTVTANERDRESNATPVVERITGAPATSRGFPTVRALLERFAG